MAALDNLILVFIAGFITALATGIGALPFFIVDHVNDRLNVVLWGLASGIMVSASIFGLISEGLSEAQSQSDLYLVGIGILAGVVLVIVGHHVITGAEIDPQQYAEADFKKLVLILGILTIHSFPEGVAIGVSFADLNFNIPDALHLLGFTIPLLAVFMTVAISIHNIPEGVAISIPLQAMGVSKWRMVWWAIFSSLPQPIGAVIAFYFVRLARQFLPFGFGFAAGAMIYLVLTEFIPEAIEIGEDLPGRGRRELVAGVVVGLLVMVPLAFI